jgi:hypothetical protein
MVASRVSLAHVNFCKIRVHFMYNLLTNNSHY